MEPFPDLASVTDTELAEMIAELEEQEQAISYRRRLLHGKIDVLRSEYEARVRSQIERGEAVVPPPGAQLAPRPIFEGRGELPPERELEAVPDLESVTDAELHEMIRQLEVEEDDVSLHRRLVQGRLDELRAARELIERHGTLDIGMLTKVLAAGPPPSTEGGQ